MEFRVSMEPFTPEHGEALVARCLDFYRAAPAEEDGWRRTEWPFCSRPAAESLALSLSLQPVAGGFPAAYAFAADRAPGRAPEDTAAGAPEGPAAGGNWIPDGVVAATHFDKESRSALLGTYLTPSKRGEGIQRHAKEALFEKLQKFIQTYYLLIHDENAPSLRALEKLETAREMKASGLPALLKEELCRHPAKTRVFRIDLR